MNVIKNTLKEQMTKLRCPEHDKQLIQLCLDQNILPSQRPLCEQCLMRAVMIPISVDRAMVMLRMIQNHEDVAKDPALVSVIQQCLLGGERPLQLKDIQTIATLLSNKFTKIRDNFVLRSKLQQGKDKTYVDSSETFTKQKRATRKHQVFTGNQTIVVKESTKYEAKTGIEWIKTIIETEDSSSSFISQSFSPLIKIWSGGKFKELKVEGQFVRCITFFDDELIACFGDMSIRIWKRLETGEFQILQTMKEQHKDEIWSIVIHFETFITGSYDSSLKVYSRRHTKKQKDSYSCIQQVTLDQSQITCMSIREDIIVYGTKSGMLGFCYFTDHWKCLYTKSKHVATVQCIAFKNDENLFATGADDRQILIWQARNDEEFQCIQEIKGLSSYIFCIQFHPTFPAFLCGGLDNKLLLYIVNQQEKWVLNQEMNKDNPITTISFLKDNYRFYIGTSVGSIILHEIDKQQ